MAADVCAEERAQTEVLLLQEDRFDGRTQTGVKINKVTGEQPIAAVGSEAKSFIARFCNEFTRRLEEDSDKVKEWSPVGVAEVSA